MEPFLDQLVDSNGPGCTDIALALAISVACSQIPAYKTSEILSISPGLVPSSKSFVLAPLLKRSLIIIIFIKMLSTF